MSSSSQIDSMFHCSQLLKAHDVAKDNGHGNIASTLKLLAEVQEITSKGEEGDKLPAVQTERGRKALTGLERAKDHKGEPPISH